MKIGFPNNPRKDICKEISWIGEHGFDFVDLFLEEDKAVPEKIDVYEVRKLLQTFNLDIVGHTAWYLPIGSPVRSLRQTAVRELEKYFKVLSELGAKFVTVHANWPGGMFSAKEGIKFQVESLNFLIDYAKSSDLKIMYEPMDTSEDNLENVSSILNELPEIFLHIDIGHASLFGNTPEIFIKKFHSRIKHVHLHDNDKRKDLHLPLDCGKIEWRNIIKTLKKYYDGTITLEIFSKDRDYVLLSKEKLRKAWKES